ncbi:MAG: hypothetical protein SGILL_008204 [Bacillariaceae sp.]
MSSNNTSSDAEAQSASNGGTRSHGTSNARSNRPHRRELTDEEKQGQCICISILVVFVLIFSSVMVAVSLRKVDETEYGVKYARYKKELDDAAVSGGLFPGPPGYKMIKFPSTFLTANFDDRTCVSRDGLRVQFSVTFQYQMTAENVVPAILKYRDAYKWREIVEQGGLSAMHHACGDFFISDFQNKRGDIQEQMLQNLRLKLEGDQEEGETTGEGVFAVAISVQLKNLKLPDEYNKAVENKQAAEEDIALAIAQRKQSTTKAETELLKAHEDARKILNSANSEAEVLSTEANLKASETTYAFEKEAETIVELKNALNLSTEGVLTALANNLYSEAKNLKVTAGQPAKLGRQDEL